MDGTFRDKTPRQISSVAVTEKHAAFWPCGETQVLQALRKTFPQILFLFISIVIVQYSLPFFPLRILDLQFLVLD